MTDRQTDRQRQTEWGERGWRWTRTKGEEREREGRMGGGETNSYQALRQKNRYLQ